MTLPTGEFDIFLSHASPDKPWVETLKGKLEALGLRVWLDQDEIRAGDNWVIKLSDGLEKSRYMVLVLSDHTADRGWVIQEWTSFMGGHGPLGRLLPVTLDSVKLPFILNATQAIAGVDRNAERVAAEIFKAVGDPRMLAANDPNRMLFGRNLVFTVSRDGDELVLITPDGEERRSTLPWKQGNDFFVAHLEFSKLHREALAEGPGRADLFRHARTLGDALFSMLFDEDDAEKLKALIGGGRPRPVIQIRSGDALLRSLPWELLHLKGRFLLREGDVDLLRTTTDEVDGGTLLKAPSEPFKLVVNVSAPEDSGLNYEAESYRISLATAERCAMVPTELGTLDDLIETVARETPQGIHFSGHGMPGALLFENDEGRNDQVAVQDLIQKLWNELPDDQPLPPFFYLASCHGNEPVDLEKDEPGSWSAAVQLHQAGVSQVVGYFGPIVDELSTRAEEALYEAIASGKTTRDAVRAARLRLAEPFYASDGKHRPTREGGLGEAPQAEFETALDTHPFAWAQLVFYHRGPEWSLSIETVPGKRKLSTALKRSFEGFGDRRVLRAGFIGRRQEQHKIRKRLREGGKVFVFQGLGGLGKSTLAQKVLPWLTDDGADVCTIWCQEAEKSEGSRADVLVTQLLAYCRNRFGLDWEQVVQRVDQVAGDDSGQRFLYFLQALVQNAPGLVLYLDNLESLLNGPENGEEGAFGEWAEPALQMIWQNAHQMAEDAERFHLVASCRYKHGDFGDAVMPVSPLPPDALFRLTAWHPSLQKLHARTRARLVSRLDGHPRAVDFADDLVAKALTNWKNKYGTWSLSTPPKDEEIEKEWDTLVGPALPAVAEKLKDNLLLQAIWDKVLDQRAQRFLYRMTVLRQPAEWPLLGLLGEQDEGEEAALATAEGLRDTSLLEQMEVFVQAGEDHVNMIPHFLLHPATAQFVTAAHPADPDLLHATHRRLGEHLEAEAKNSPYIETVIEAGHHLFEAGDYDRASELLCRASEWLQGHGRVREGLKLLEPFLERLARERMSPKLGGQTLGVVASGHLRLGEVEKAIGYYEQRLVIARAIGDRQGEGNALGNLGLAYADLGEVEKAIIYYEQQLAIVRAIGDRQREGNALGNLGSAYLRLSEVEKAVCYYEQALVIFGAIGDRRGDGNVLGNLGIAYARLGEVEKAIGYHEQALIVSREIGDRQGEGSDLGNLGSAYLRLGEVEKAIGYCEQRLVIARAIGDREGEGGALGNLGNAYARLGEVEKAIIYYEQHLLIVRAISDRRGEGVALSNLGLAYEGLDEVEKARVHFQQGLAIGQQIKATRIVQVCDAGLARLADKG